MAEYISKNEVLNLIMYNDKVCHYADERYENVVYATACRISDVVANMPVADVQPLSIVAEHIKNRLYETAFNTDEPIASHAIEDMAERIDFWINELKGGEHNDT